MKKKPTKVKLSKMLARGVRQLTGQAAVPLDVRKEMSKPTASKSAREAAKKKAPREDFSQAAARIVREATDKA